MTRREKIEAAVEYVFFVYLPFITLMWLLEVLILNGLANRFLN